MEELSRRSVEDLNHISQLDLIKLQNNPYSEAKYTFFSSTHKTFSRTDHKSVPKTNLSIFKDTEIIQNMGRE